MKITSIHSGDRIQVYHIENPTAKFKKHFPKKYNCVIMDEWRTKRFSVNKLPKITKWDIGYIFTYDPKVNITQKPLPNQLDIGHTFPGCLDMYFTKNVDLVLSCANKDKCVHPLMLNDLVIRCDSSKLSGITNWKDESLNTPNNFVLTHIKEGTKRILEKVYSEPIHLINWISIVLDKFPTNSRGLPVKFPNVINDGEVFPVDMKNIFLEYDFRARDEDHEKNFIKHFEETFEDANYEVELSNSYNNILPDIIKQLKDKKISYKTKETGNIILKWKDLKKIKYEFQITDFI